MVTKRPIMYWVKTSSIKLQVVLLAVIAVNVVARVFPLEMQKRIINKAIAMKNLELLVLYCGMYLAAVLLASGLKFVINVIQTYLSQQALARIRKDLYAHILTLPLDFFRNSSSGMVVTSLVTEVAAAGELVGQAIAVPLNNILTLLAFAAYMFYLNPLLGAISMAIYPIVLFIVPRLQKRSNEANKARVDTSRKLSNKIGETITGIHEVHGNGSYSIESRKYGQVVQELFKIRVVWNLYKFGIKVLNSLFQSMGPFFLFIIGGYLAINGRFDLGALVAFLSAYEKLYDPWKELMDFYQVYQDANVSYKRLMEYFDIPPSHALAPPDREPYDLDGAIQVRDLSFAVGGGIQLLKDVSLDLKPGEQMALVGFSGSGKSTLSQCIAQLYTYTGGSLQIGGKEVAELTKRDVVRNVGVVAQFPYIFNGTIKENLLYSCEAVLEDSPNEQRITEPSLDEMIEIIQQVGLFVDVLRFGLNTLLQQERDNELVDKLVRVRKSFQEEFGAELSEFIEFFDEKRYLSYSSVSANIIFGSASSPAFDPERLNTNEYFITFLDEAQLTKPLTHLGWELARQTVDILGDMPLEDMFFEQTPIKLDEFEDVKGAVERAHGLQLHEISSEDRAKFLDLALRFTPGVHNVASLPPMVEHLILDARLMFRDRISKDQPDAITFYKPSEYIYSQTILANILFGKPRTDRPNAQDRISQSVIHLLIEEDLLERIVELGMDFVVGTKGDRLSGGQRQKLAIARVFLKKPSVLIMDEATSGLDNASQQRIQNLLETKMRGKSTVISVVHRLDIIKNYDKVAVMKSGKIIEMGSYHELMDKKGVLYGLVHGAKSDAQ